MTVIKWDIKISQLFLTSLQEVNFAYIEATLNIGWAFIHFYMRFRTPIIATDGKHIHNYIFRLGSGLCECISAETPWWETTLLWNYAVRLLLIAVTVICVRKRYLQLRVHCFLIIHSLKELRSKSTLVCIVSRRWSSFCLTWSWDNNTWLPPY